jgi:hypothetical protein
MAAQLATPDSRPARALRTPTSAAAACHPALLLPAPPPQSVSSPLLDCTLGGRVRCPCWDGRPLPAAPNGTAAKNAAGGGGGDGAAAWPGLQALWKSNKVPPVVALSISQADSVRDEMDARKASGKSGYAFVRTQPAPYRRMSGTSMAT